MCWRRRRRILSKTNNPNHNQKQNKKQGDEHPGHVPADIVFVIDEKLHGTYRRDGNDLLTTHRVTLADALCGASFKLASLDGRELDVSTSGVITPNAVKILK